ncbi:MAG TPA: MFS transporter [Candidatus Sulfotelmatobacter sp.]|nr:MFS transporter [Candidatus Sulfotelmatobacter sp.]
MVISGKQRGSAAAGVYIGAALIVLDASVLNVALPNIRSTINASFDALLWILNAYTLTFACCLILCGTFADRIGKRGAFLGGVVLFAAASFGCAMAPNASVLIGFRALQGLGAALVATTSLSIIGRLYIEPRERARALGMWAGVTGIAFAGGPIVGGALITWVGWKSIFFINLPVCALSFLLSVANIPAIERRLRAWNAVGQILIILFLAAATFAIITSSDVTWRHPRVIGASILSVVSAIALIGYERAAAAGGRESIIPPRLLDQGMIRAGLIAAFVCNFCLYGLLLVFTLMFQRELHYSAVLTGLAFMPITVVGACTSGLVSGTLMARYGAPRVLVSSAFLSALGVLPLVEFEASSPYLLAAFGFVVFALGNGLCVPAMTNVVLSHCDSKDHNVASSMINTARQSGGVLGTSALGAIFAASPGHPRLDIMLGIVFVMLLVAGWFARRAYVRDVSTLACDRAS